LLDDDPVHCGHDNLPKQGELSFYGSASTSSVAPPHGLALRLGQRQAGGQEGAPGRHPATSLSPGPNLAPASRPSAVRAHAARKTRSSLPAWLAGR
jgi:hypothetical protein